MKTIRILLSLGTLAAALLLNAACATSTQSAAKAQEAPALPDPAKLAASPAAPDDHATQHAAEDKVLRMKPAEAIKLVKDGGAILVDVRDLNSYENMHAKGALHVAYQDIVDGKLDKLPKNKHLIFYCT
jgi:hypothetical protein